MNSIGEFRHGDSIGPYRVEGPLGKGRMGRVYRAVGPDGEQAAVKLINPELASDTVFLRRFSREARAAQLISHPNIVPVLDSGQADGMPYLAQAFVAGGSLADLIARSGPLDLAATVATASQVAAGLDALHAAGLVHRDVKPANILLDEARNAYISDFGLAKDSQASMLTRPGQALGSLDYMAPEQIRGEQVSPATDVYALGCVVWECLMGGPPFGGRPSMRVLYAHMQEEPVDPCAQRRDLLPAVGRAVLRALAKEADERPPSASSYVQMIARAADLAAEPARA